MKYKLVIFDLDGTILNTIGDLCSSCNYALKMKGLPSVTMDQVRSYIGNGIKTLMRLASKKRCNIDELLKDFKMHYQRNYNTLTKPYDGITDVFEFCKKQGVLMGVLTNKVEEIARKLVEEQFPATMDFIYGEVAGRARKPDPTFLLEVISAYGLSKEEVLYIGDSEVDIKTCKQAGIEGLFVSYGYRTKEVLLKETSRVIDHPKEMIQYLGED